ncbi:MAG TPA: cyclic nucleotide-binding domain-containing protein [Blastocatellia bacterium]|nr:cyclic nucleotide-binding domain-containing protein [Blastocatellia bacterium]
MPKEITKHRDVLAAIGSVGAIADLTAKDDGHYEYELDLEVIVYGRNYNGKKVGPYVRLLTYGPGEEIVREGDWGGNNFYIVVSGKAEVLINDSSGNMNKVSEIPAGAQFGEMSVLAGVPRSATVRAPSNQPVEVLEVQRPALRLLRKLPKFSESLDTTYRRNGRSAVIQEIRSVTQLSPEAISQLEAISQFRVFAKNHVLFRAGEQIRRLYVIKSGWAKLVPKTQVMTIAISEGERRNWETKAKGTYVGPSHCFGLEAITRDGEWDHSCTLLGRTEVLEISISKLRQYPELRETLMLAFTNMAPQDLTTSRQPLPIAKSQAELIETGLVDTTNLLVMDMDLCIRCGNCSLACHKIHGQSRLVRRGVHVTRPVKLKEKANFQSLLAPSVCFHCKDPECLTGCPTGSIGRFSDGQVDIDAKTCIGCTDCATQCPYNAISMVPRKTANGNGKGRWEKWFGVSPQELPPAVQETEDLLAVKCNLCVGTTLNPPDSGSAKRQAYSCEENCPTGSLLRVDPKVYFAEIKNIEGAVFRDSNHVILRHTSHKDFGKRVMHMIGIAITLLSTALTLVGLLNYGLETPLLGSWFDMRWLTGIVGFTGIAGVMAYPVRRQIYKRRAGPLRHWLLSHSYLGIIAGIVLLLHGGTESGGILTTSLMISYDLVILTGLFGILVYYFAPRLLTKIEGQPLLLDDLLARRAELGQELGESMGAASAEAQNFVEKKVLPKLFSLRFLLRQYLKRETLDQLVVETQQRFDDAVSDLSPKERDLLFGAIEKAATLRRVDALIYLHQSLKIWLAPHVLFTSIMLALMIVHIIQAIYCLAN